MNSNIDAYIATLGGIERDKAIALKYLTDGDEAFFAAINAAPERLQRAKNFCSKRWAAGRASTREISLTALTALRRDGKAAQMQLFG